MRATCDTCERPMRPHKARKEDFPGTIAVGSGGTCNVCFKRQGRTKPTDLGDDLACVLVRVYVRRSTYRRLGVVANRCGVDVGALLSEVADRSLAAGEVSA